MFRACIDNINCSIYVLLFTYVVFKKILWSVAGEVSKTILALGTQISHVWNRYKYNFKGSIHLYFDIVTEIVGETYYNLMLSNIRQTDKTLSETYIFAINK